MYCLECFFRREASPEAAVMGLCKFTEPLAPLYRQLLLQCSVRVSDISAVSTSILLTSANCAAASMPA